MQQVLRGLLTASPICPKCPMKTNLWGIYQILLNVRRHPFQSVARRFFHSFCSDIPVLEHVPYAGSWDIHF